jgi:hypothetical protein
VSTCWQSRRVSLKKQVVFYVSPAANIRNLANMFREICC